MTRAFSALLIVEKSQNTLSSEVTIFLNLRIYFIENYFSWVFLPKENFLNFQKLNFSLNLLVHFFLENLIHYGNAACTITCEFSCTLVRCRPPPTWVRKTRSAVIQSFLLCKPNRTMRDHWHQTRDTRPCFTSLHNCFGLKRDEDFFNSRFFCCVGAKM